MLPTMSSRIAVQEIGCLTALLLVSSAQAVLNYEAHRHDTIPGKRNVILTTRDFLEQLNFVAPKASYTLQEATEHLLQFSAFLEMRILDTFGRLLYDHYDEFSVTEVESMHKVHQEILERRYDVFSIIPRILRHQDTRPSRICVEIYDHATESCLRNSVSTCRRIKKQHDHSHPKHRDTTALNVTYHVFHSAKISKQYPKGFSSATILSHLQQERLTITPNLISGLLYRASYENYNDDIRLAERELILHFHKITGSKIPTAKKVLRQFHTVNSFLKYYIDMYGKKFLHHELKKYAILIAKRIKVDIGTIDENIHLLGNVYENKKIHVGYLFDLVLPNDLIEVDIIEAKKYLVKKLNKFNVVEKYLRVERYQQATPAQLMMEITGQLRDIDFAKNIATSLRMHAKFWRTSHMIESLDELLELFDTYENLRHLPRYVRMIQKIEVIRTNLQHMKDISVEILCSTPRACLRLGLQMILECKLLSSEIKEEIKEFLELSDICVDAVYMLQESRRSVELPFTIEKIHYSTALSTIGEATTQPSIKNESSKSTEEEFKEIDISYQSKESREISLDSTESAERSSEYTSSMTSTSRTTRPHRSKLSSTTPERTTAGTTSSIAATTDTTLSVTTAPDTTVTRTTTLPTTTLSTTTLPTTITTLPTTTLPTTISTMLPTMTTTFPTTITLSTGETSSMTKIPSEDVTIEIEHSTIKAVHVSLNGHKNRTIIVTPDSESPCETSECSTEELSSESKETTSLLATSYEISQETSFESTPGLVTESIVSSTTEKTKEKEDCMQICLEACRSSGGSLESAEKSCEASCDSVMENCKECESGGKDDKSDCIELCSTDLGSSSRESAGAFVEISRELSGELSFSGEVPISEVSCEGSQDCTASINMHHEHQGGYGILCEIRDPHHRRQKKRLAKMRWTNVVSPAVTSHVASHLTSHVEVLEPMTSHHRREKVVNKKLYNILGTKLSKPKPKTTKVREKKSRGVFKLRGKGKDRRSYKERKMISKHAGKQPAMKFSGKMNRETTVHRTRGLTPFRHSQIKRISEESAKSISA